MGRAMLEVGKKYELHTGNENHFGRVLECIGKCVDDAYSSYTYWIRSTVTGWTIKCHGVNVYPDETIDWDFSTDGYFTCVDENGVFHQVD